MTFLRKLIPGAVAAVLCLACVPGHGEARGIVLELPVDCAVGKDCFVQNYVDQAPGPEAKDFVCGPLAYDGHDGTDFRVPTLADMRRGVPVRAAADGVIKATRDSMDDIHVEKIGRQAIAGREAGNGIVIDHGNGWETQYSHLLRGSVRVKPGQQVRAGQIIALIGHSGLAEFPHVEFAVRYQGQSVDPFTGLSPDSGCGNMGQSLWSEAARQALHYQAGGLLASGFAGGKPDLDTALDKGYAVDGLNARSPALVFWAAAWGLQEGDREVFRLFDPKGRVVAEGSSTLDRNKAQWFRFVGRKRPGEAWPRGQYRGEYIVYREQDGQQVKVVEISGTLDLL